MRVKSEQPQIQAGDAGGHLSRRDFLRKAALLTAGLALFSPTHLLARPVQPQTLTFYHTHTGETLDLCYINGTCSSVSKQELNVFLRDFRTGDVHPIDIGLVHILDQIQQIAGSNGVFEVISGYRSPKTNNALRSASSGVAKKSLHMRGKAIDIRLTDLPTRELRDIATSLKAGGVGYYAKSDFVHIDTGRVRTW